MEKVEDRETENSLAIKKQLDSLIDNLPISRQKDLLEIAKLFYYQELCPIQTDKL